MGRLFYNEPVVKKVVENLKIINIITKMLSKTKKLIPIAAYFMPLLMFAQTLDTVAVRVKDILDLIVPIIMVLALIYFFVGLVKYIMSAGDEEAKGAGRSIMINGVIALFVMAAVWGLVAILNQTFLGGTTTPAPDPGTLIPPGF